MHYLDHLSEIVYCFGAAILIFNILEVLDNEPKPEKKNRYKSRTKVTDLPPEIVNKILIHVVQREKSFWPILGMGLCHNESFKNYCT